MTDPKEKTKLHLSLSTSPTLSISDPDAVLYVIVNLWIAATDDAHKEKPLTLSIQEPFLEETSPDNPCADVFMQKQGGFSRLISASGDRSKSISLGFFHVHNRGQDCCSLDIRELGCRLLTVPAAAASPSEAAAAASPSEAAAAASPSEAAAAASPSEAAASPSKQGRQRDTSRVATITHKLDWNRIFSYEEKRSKEDLVPGEVFEICMNKRYMPRRPVWCCWGDLDTDLKGKKLHIWPSGGPGSYPKDAKVRPEVDESWVLGEDCAEFYIEDVTPGGKASFTIVE